MKITSLQMENVKRIRAIRLEPSADGLTVIGGKNAQGKTSVLDGIAYALGGEKYKPTNLLREGAVAETVIHIETDDGLVIERKGKNANLTVTDRDGKRHGQAILDAVISKLAIDLPKFLNAKDKEKADILLQILGVGEQLAQLEREEKAKYDLRRSVGRMAEQKKQAAADMPYHDDVPDEPVSVSELVKKQQEVLARNGIREEHRRNLCNLLAENDRLAEQIAALMKRKEEIAPKIADAQKIEQADGEDESTAELEAQIADFETVNSKIAENAAKRSREEEADDLQDQYDTLTKEIEDIRKKRLALLDGCDLPYPGLSVEDGVLLLNGKAWDCMSGAQQMIVGCAIASRLNPSCKFVLLDKLEQLDLETLGEFDNWLKENDLQCIATRVSTGGECALVIEDGEAAGEKVAIPMPKSVANPKAKEGPNKLTDDDYE